MSSSPRVVLACDYFLKYSIGLADGLVGQGAAVLLLTRTHDQEFGRVPGAMRREVERLLGDSVQHEQLPGRVRDPAGWKAMIALRRRIRRFRPDFVHLQESVANDPRLAVAAGARRGHYAFTVHDPSPHPGDRPRSRKQRAARRALSRGAGLIFVHGEALRAELVEADRPGAPLEIVPHGAGAPAALAFPERPALLFFGRISEYKGVDTLLDAMPLVWRHDPSVTLTVAGRGELPEHQVLSDARVMVRQEYVPEEEVPELFAAASCVVLPYKQASQSGVGSQARQFGRPLVTTAVGSLPELVSGDTGRIVPPDDPGALAGAVAEVVLTPGLARAMGERAAQDLLSQATWSRVAQLTLDAYQRHLG